MKNINRLQRLQLLLEVCDFLRDISSGAPITDASRDHATEFVALMDAEFNAQWDGETSIPAVVEHQDGTVIRK